MSGEAPVDTGIDEARTRLGSERRPKVLLPGLDHEPKRVSQLAIQRYRPVITLTKGTIELSQVNVGLNSGVEHVPEAKPVHLIPRGLRISAAATQADVGIHRSAKRQRDAHSGAHTLKQVFVQQSGIDQPRVKSRDVSKVVLVEIKLKILGGLQAQRQEAHRDAGARRYSRYGRSMYLIGLQLVIHAHYPFPGKRVFKEQEIGIGLPANTRDSEARGAIGVEAFVATLLVV